MNNPQLRLNKFLAERLGVSRREADGLIASGKIFVNQKPATIGVKVDKNDKVCYIRKIVPFDTVFLYLAFHKPIGYVCSRRTQGSTPTLYDLLPAKYHKLKTVGRLDKDSSGLILLTNDGDFAFQMTHPKFHKNKIYEVELDKPLEPLHQQMISDYGIMLDDGPSKFTIVRDDNKYIVTLSEGRNRQIRRTFMALGYTVTKLHRITFGKYELGSLKPGKYVIIKP
ncbi:rRNA pseudouridine synthase [Candidatus Saccharibacteria bacterium]|nr:rRNA pseudouridine synthase [Candidatus Saccharibacteria bacterium]